jgi:ADP-ribose pyrophosphatase YjhB (NUDIX family)
MSAGMLLFVHEDAFERMHTFINLINGATRVSPEVLSLHLVRPTREAMRDMSLKLRDDPALQHLEHIRRLKPNNAVRDLTAPWRLSHAFTTTHLLLVNLETVNPAFRAKYPDPNLTLPAGGVECGERPRVAAHRELLEETRIKVDPALVQTPMGLFRGGIRMYQVPIYAWTPLHMAGNTLYVGDIPRIEAFYSSWVLPNDGPAPPPSGERDEHHLLNGSTSGSEAAAA